MWHARYVNLNILKYLFSRSYVFVLVSTQRTNTPFPLLSTVSTHNQATVAFICQIQFLLVIRYNVPPPFPISHRNLQGSGSSLPSVSMTSGVNAWIATLCHLMMPVVSYFLPYHLMSTSCDHTLTCCILALLICTS